MKDKYIRTATSVSLVNYHFVFCPKYRRKIFRMPGVERRFKQLAILECQKLGISILAMECHIDHVHMFIQGSPSMAPSFIMKHIKGVTSRLLRQEFPALADMPGLWSRSYFVSTAGNVSSEAIKRDVETQKTRP